MVCRCPVFEPCGGLHSSDVLVTCMLKKFSWNSASPPRTTTTFDRRMEFEPPRRCSARLFALLCPGVPCKIWGGFLLALHRDCTKRGLGLGTFLSSRHRSTLVSSHVFFWPGRHVGEGKCFSLSPSLACRSSHALAGNARGSLESRRRGLLKI